MQYAVCTYQPHTYMHSIRSYTYAQRERVYTKCTLRYAALQQSQNMIPTYLLVYICIFCILYNYVLVRYDGESESGKQCNLQSWLLASMATNYMYVQCTYTRIEIN